MVTYVFVQSVNITSQSCMVIINILFTSLLHVSTKLGHRHATQTFERKLHKKLHKIPLVPVDYCQLKRYDIAVM